MEESITGRLLRGIVAPVQRLRRRWLRRRGRRPLGVHALALTPARRIVLVKLRYARGWRLPGGGRGADEEPRDAALRELREEIGMVSHAAVEAVRAGEEADGKATLFIVREVVYRPRRWSLEVEKVRAFALDALPGDLAEPAARAMVAARGRL